MEGRSRGYAGRELDPLQQHTPPTRTIVFKCDNLQEGPRTASGAAFGGGSISSI